MNETGKLPEEKYGNGKLPYNTIRKYIEKYPALQAGEKNEDVPNHQCAKLSPMLLQRISVLKEGQDRRSWNDSLKLKVIKIIKVTRMFMGVYLGTNHQ